MSLETSMTAMKDSQIALNTAIKTIADKTKDIIDSKGQANGVASLDATGKVPAGQLPSMNYAPVDEDGRIAESVLPIALETALITINGV